MIHFLSRFTLVLILLADSILFPILTFFFASTIAIFAQTQSFKFDLPSETDIEVENPHGRVVIFADKEIEKTLEIEASSDKPILESDLKKTIKKKSILIWTDTKEKKRIDLRLRIPPDLRVKVRTKEGEVRLSGYFRSCEVKTETGTISTDIPIDNIHYSFLWTSSYPRFLSSVLLEEIKEKAAGQFLISGRLGEKVNNKTKRKKGEEKSDNEKSNSDGSKISTKNENSSGKKDEQNNKTNNETTAKRETILDFKTSRGIILFNVSPSEVPADLRERPLTEAAKAIIRSGDSFLTEAIRRVSPRYFGDYAKTLPPRKSQPFLGLKQISEDSNAETKQIVVRVTDAQGRAVIGLEKKDFIVSEGEQEKEIISVEPVTAPMNLVLLLDVSGSVENYIDFIRKAARAFIDTMNRQDRIAIVIFNDDVKVLSDFTTDREKLSKSLDDFDAGGGTAYYDALAYTLIEMLNPLKQSRSAIVVLSDGDDNRSFLSFNDLIPTIQESGALIYPLYVPSGLIAFSSQTDPEKAVDPVWTKYMSLTSKAQEEGAKLAKVSGGVYYPIRRIEQIREAYEDIVLQLRSAYKITFRSKIEVSNGKTSQRLRVKVLRNSVFATIEQIKAGNSNL